MLSLHATLHLIGMEQKEKTLTGIYNFNEIVIYNTIIYCAAGFESVKSQKNSLSFT